MFCQDHSMDCPRARSAIRGFVAVFFLLITGTALAQSGNFTLPIEQIEETLRYEDLTIFRLRDARFAGDLTKRAILYYQGTKAIQVKWKQAPYKGETFNNQPRYEMAAYAFQKLFLEPEEYVVPPTVCRTFPLKTYRKYDPH